MPPKVLQDNLEVDFVIRFKVPNEGMVWEDLECTDRLT